MPPLNRMTQVYLRPIGLLWGEDAGAAVANGTAGLLAGGPAAFTLAELIVRDGKTIESEQRSYRDMLASRDRLIAERLALVTEPRARLAGTEWRRGAVMGIINATPDSFSDGGDHLRIEDAVAHGARLAGDGASIIDVGGESTRPGSDGVAIEEERKRVIGIIAELSARGLAVSIDTRKPEIMKEAAEAGAVMINDITALRFDPMSRKVAAALKLPVCLMHARGEPRTMQVNPTYENVVLDVFDELENFIVQAEAAGLPRQMQLADPGIGFGKTYRHNLEILRCLSLYHGLGVMLVVGASRKAFIGALTDEKTAKHRVFGSVGAAIAAAAQGAQILRVHDVKATVQALAVWRASIDPPASGL
jgi:dihydropteroate synthase